MPHVRSQLRTAIVAAVTGLPTTGTRVYSSRVFDIGRASRLPALVVETGEETSQLASTGRQSYLRELAVRIQAIASEPVNVDDALDTIAAEVETALTKDALGGLAKTVLLEQTDLETTSDGDNEVATLVMTFSVLYQTAINAPEVAL